MVTMLAMKVIFKRSSTVNANDTAPTFSCDWCNLVVPGIGTIVLCGVSKRRECGDMRYNLRIYYILEVTRS